MTATDKQSYLYRSGDLFAAARVRRFLETFLVGSYQSPVYLTYWSVLHFVSGVLTAYVLVELDPAFLPKVSPYWVGLSLHTLWEGWQMLIGMSHPLRLTGHNGIVDIAMDTALFMAGMWVVMGC
jgi:hypothetical protein